ncbi:bifunctional bis(5'-adenosyl)-triphosphatase/adenylylsulfatase FHIT-like protein, partial [Tanacetum coccineum]
MEKLVPWLRRSSAVLRPKATRFHSTRSSILSTPQLEDVHRKFWMHKVDPNQMFYSTELSFAMMNILPLCPEEVSDLRISTQKIGVQVKNYHGASSTTYLIQDGPLAGQTIPHVHIHIIPRVAGDWKDNDRIYDA